MDTAAAQLTAALQTKVEEHRHQLENSLAAERNRNEHRLAVEAAVVEKEEQRAQALASAMRERDDELRVVVSKSEAESQKALELFQRKVEVEKVQHAAALKDAEHRALGKTRRMEILRAEAARAEEMHNEATAEAARKAEAALAVKDEEYRRKLEAALTQQQKDHTQALAALTAEKDTQHRLALAEARSEKEAQIANPRAESESHPVDQRLRLSPAAEAKKREVAASHIHQAMRQDDIGALQSAMADFADSLDQDEDNPLIAEAAQMLQERSWQAFAASELREVTGTLPDSTASAGHIVRPQPMSDRLNDAVRKKDIDKLQESLALTDADADVEADTDSVNKAADAMAVVAWQRYAKEQLTSAISSRNLDDLHTAIQDGYDEEVDSHLIAEAKNVLLHELLAAMVECQSDEMKSTLIKDATLLYPEESWERCRDAEFAPTGQGQGLVDRAFNFLKVQVAKLAAESDLSTAVEEREIGKLQEAILPCVEGGVRANIINEARLALEEESWRAHATTELKQAIERKDIKELEVAIQTGDAENVDDDLLQQAATVLQHEKLSVAMRSGEAQQVLENLASSTGMKIDDDLKAKARDMLAAEAAEVVRTALYKRAIDVSASLTSSASGSVSRQFPELDRQSSLQEDTTRALAQAHIFAAIREGDIRELDKAIEEAHSTGVSPDLIEKADEARSFHIRLAERRPESPLLSQDINTLRLAAVESTLADISVSAHREEAGRILAEEGRKVLHEVKMQRSREQEEGRKSSAYR